MDLSLSRSLPIPIYAVHPIRQWAPLALGILAAWLQEQRPTQCRIIAPFAENAAQLQTQLAQYGPGLILFSNYMWTREANVSLSALAKQWSPESIIIHGGPDTPAYPESCKLFLQQHPFVDLALHGAGEETLLEVFDTLLNSGEMRQVAGLSFLQNESLVQGPIRPRPQDINRYPSPYLTGLFDNMPWQEWNAITLETNRGCPYGCTFCDWGSATQQKMQKFDLERINAEVTWLAQHQIPKLWIADSNFGIFERDLEITRRICAIKETYGYPQLVITNYAKNTKKHLVEIIEMLVDHGLVGTGIVSLQTRDPKTLAAVRRSNIKTEEYDRLRQTFESRKLPMSTQLMIGLPGSTRESFKADLRFFFAQTIDVQIFRTVVLPNSPMAAPDYRNEHGLVFDESGMLQATNLISAPELAHIEQLGRLFRCTHTYGMFRYLLSFLQRDYGLDPIDILDQCLMQARESSNPWIQALWDHESPPHDLLTSHARLRESLRATGNSAQFYQAFTELLRSLHPEIIQDSALETALKVQEAVMPHAGRQYPYTLELPHDYVRYAFNTQSQLQLKDYPPGSISIEDPLHVSDESLSLHLERRQRPVVIWELLSPLSPEGTESALFAAQVIRERANTP